MAVTPLSPATGVGTWSWNQHVTAPPVTVAQAAYGPVAIAVAPVTPDTDTGVIESPTGGEPLRPQHLTAPPASTAQVSWLVATALAPAIPLTVTGLGELTIVPSPSWLQ